MSDWLPPSAQEYPASESDGIKKLVGTVQDVAQKTREATKNLLRTAGIFLTEAGMRIESSLTVNGDFASTGSADITGTTHIGGSTDIDGTLNVDADSTFHGSMVIDGDLSVPNGSITNAALQSPIIFDTASGNVNGPLNIVAAEQTFISLSVPVPAGYSRGSIQAQGSIGLVNPTGAASSAAGRVYIDHPNPALSSFGARRYQSAGPASDLATFPVDFADFAVTGGTSITVRLTMQSVINWGTTSGGATLNVIALFTRA